MNQTQAYQPKIQLPQQGRLVILGAGESGVGTAILGQKLGFDVFVSDKSAIPDKYKSKLLHFGIDHEENQHTEAFISSADLVVKSPGIPDKVSIIKSLKEKDIPVISEIEFAAQYTDAIISGITGSNGKTTTTMMLYHILKKAGLKVAEGGNIGKSFAQLIAEGSYTHYVLELSSFQLDGIVNMAPHIAVITNITPDHLDRYEYDFDKYIDAKFRITMNQTNGDFLIYDADDQHITSWLKKNKTQAQLVPFSLKKKLSQGAYLENDTIYINLNNQTLDMSLSSIAVQGNHNVKNTMAASMAATLLKVRKQTIRESMEDFEGATHRLEKVLTIGGVEYINDSKATNINAVYYALDSMKNPTVWIVGGVDKGNDYMELMPLVREKVKAIVCLGVDNAKIIETFKNVMPIIVETMGAEEAVKVANKLADKGDTVLLSPACASFDLFKNYEDRGNQFKEAVLKL
jgi:UDP-N-acetylmuramoylalanine--D-glutamate ligase